MSRWGDKFYKVKCKKCGKEDTLSAKVKYICEECFEKERKKRNDYIIDILETKEDLPKRTI
jgi:hypothetical protein